MSFPQTRPTLIRRIAAGGSHEDWRQFLHDYWGPICRFASRRAGLSMADAEDVASQTFEALLANRLLQRWNANRTAKLRSLLCSVVRNVLSNRARVAEGRRRRLKQRAEQADDAGLQVASSAEPPQEQVDVFYAAWAEDLLHQSIDALRDELHRRGHGDRFRVLYGRLCEGMTMREISRSLGIPTTTAENHQRAARRGLATELESRVRRHVQRYCDPGEAGNEFQAEWAQLGEFLRRHGGLEQVVRRSYREMVSAGQRRSESFLAAAAQIDRALARAPAPAAQDVSEGETPTE